MLFSPCVLSASAKAPVAVLWVPSDLGKERLDTGGSIAGAGVVEKQCKRSGGCVVTTSGVASERTITDGSVMGPVVLLKSASKPLAVLKLPVVLENMAIVPLAVFWLPVVLFLKGRPLPRPCSLCPSY